MDAEMPHQKTALFPLYILIIASIILFPFFSSSETFQKQNEIKWFVSLAVSLNLKNESFALIKWAGEIEPRHKIATAITDGKFGPCERNRGRE